MYFTAFLLVLVAVNGLFASRQDFAGRFNRTLRSIQRKLGLLDDTGSLYAPTFLTQEVVQEESQIIDVVERVSPAVVSIVVRINSFDIFSGPITDESGIGTGFIVDQNGLIITNSHVVDSVDGEYSVVLKGGANYQVDRVHLDEQNDLAILEITARDLPTVQLGDSDSLRVGQQAIAIGNALGQFQNTVTVGVISGIGRNITASRGFGMESKTYESVLQTDAAINPGNSGGPLLNSAGQVIGINVATSSGAENISFAIPINTLKPVLESFVKEGRIIKPYLGVSYVMISKEVAALRQLPQGAFVSRVIAGSPADSAGLQRGDIIIKFNGQDLNVMFSLVQAIARQKVGDEVTLTVDREGQKLELKAVIAEMPQTSL